MRSDTSLQIIMTMARLIELSFLQDGGVTKRTFKSGDGLDHPNDGARKRKAAKKDKVCTTYKLPICQS